MSYRIGQRVTYSTKEFDGNFSTECMIVEVKADHAIAVEMNNPNPMRLWIDETTQDMFK